MRNKFLIGLLFCFGFLLTGTIVAQETYKQPVVTQFADIGNQSDVSVMEYALIEAPTSLNAFDNIVMYQVSTNRFTESFIHADQAFGKQCMVFDNRYKSVPDAPFVYIKHRRMILNGQYIYSYSIKYKQPPVRQRKA